jgi:hypothetical protein
LIINRLKLTNLLWPEFRPIPIWQWLKIIDPPKKIIVEVCWSSEKR